MSWLDRLRGREPARTEPLTEPLQTSVEFHGPFDGLKELGVGFGSDTRYLDGYRRYGAIWDDDGRPAELYERDARAWAVRNGLEVHPGPDAIFVKRRPDGTVRVAVDARPSGDGNPGDREPDGPEQGEGGPEGNEDIDGSGIIE